MGGSPRLEQQTGCLLFQINDLEHRQGSSASGKHLSPGASPLLGARRQVFSASGKLIGVPGCHGGRPLGQIGVTSLGSREPWHARCWTTLP